MEINPQRPVRASTKPVGKSKFKSGLAAAAATEEEGSVFIGSGLQAVICEGLDALDEMRQEKLEDGRRLARDPNYPGSQELDEVSRLAVRQFRKDSV